MLERRTRSEFARQWLATAEAGRVVRELRWLPPTTVAVEDLDALPAVVRTVR